MAFRRLEDRELKIEVRIGQENGVTPINIPRNHSPSLIALAATMKSDDSFQIVRLIDINGKMNALVTYFPNKQKIRPCRSK